MRWNASFLALMLPLAGCGGGYGFDAASGGDLPPAPQQASYPAPAGYNAPSSSYRPPADNYERPADNYDRPPASYSGPGASYGAPQGNYPAPAPSYQPPQQNYAPPPQGWQDPAASAAGPAGSSQRGANEERYDEVGYAGMRGVQGGDPAGNAIVAVHRSLPPGTIIEVTSLDTARTVLVLVTGASGASDHIMDLSPGAMRLLGASGGTIPVRARKVVTAPGDAVALREGRPAAERPDTPPVLLSALRKHLPAAPAYPAAPVYSQPAYSQPAAPAYRPPSRPAPAQGGYVVQIAALSNSARAQALASSMGGFVKPGGGFYRIQLGPFASAREAEAARARAASSGYGDARVLTQ